MTPAQQRVLDLLLEGASDKAIAAELRISRSTVKNHVGALFHTLGVHSRTELAIKILNERIARLEEQLARQNA